MKKIVFLIFIVSIVFCGCNTMTTEKKTSFTQSEKNAVATTEKFNTFTGRKPLEKVTFSVPDPENSNGLSTKKTAHSFGVARNGQVHEISRQSQSFFEKNNFNAVTYDTSGERVLYLTFDCGYENGYTNKILDTLKEKNVTAAFFCTLDNIKAEPELMARIINEGHILGNHSTNHPSFDEISRAQMANEIEQCDNYLREHFGYSAPYFRFPKGEYSESALDLVNSLGYKCVFWSLAYDDWNTENQKGKDYAFKKVSERLHPGAVILLHSVSADNAQALAEIIDYAHENGYTFKALNQL